MNAPLVIPRFIVKRGPKPNGRSIERANAAKRRNDVIDLLSQHDGMSVREMFAHFDCSFSRLRDCLCSMVNLGLISSELVKGYQGAPTAAIYRLADLEKGGRNDQASQRTITKYPLNHVRDELVSFLFGAPKHNGELTK
jgi:predicted transcriptional regulator